MDKISNILCRIKFSSGGAEMNNGKNVIIEEDIKGILERVDLTELKNKSILVTGASGLLGTYFLYTLKACIECGLQIEQVNIVCRNALPEYLQDFLTYSWIKLWRGDLCDDRFTQSLPCCDYIIHAACYGQPAKFMVDEEKTLKLNTSVLFSLLDKLNAGGKFLFLSSSAVYNGLQKEMFCETDVGTTNTLHPRACYIEGKRCGEAICNAYRKKGVDVKAVRLSYTYGPAVRKGDERALYSFVQKGLCGDILLMDAGKAERIYCYVSDAIEIMWKIFLFGKDAIYNVGAKEKTTILELAEKIAKLLGVNVVMPEVDCGVQGNAAIERLDIGKIEQEFQKEVFVSLEEGLKRTISWMRE